VTITCLFRFFYLPSPPLPLRHLSILAVMVDVDYSLGHLTHRAPRRLPSREQQAKAGWRGLPFCLSPASPRITSHLPVADSLGRQVWQTGGGRAGSVGMTATAGAGRKTGRGVALTVTNLVTYTLTLALRLSVALARKTLSRLSPAVPDALCLFCRQHTYLSQHARAAAFPAAHSCFSTYL